MNIKQVEMTQKTGRPKVKYDNPFLGSTRASTQLGKQQSQTANTTIST
jgi:hypothetical protein